MIIIAGAGLSGLLIAYRLKKAGKSVKVIEARDRIGGRIHTLISENKTPVEMGATWFWKTNQHLIKLLEELELSTFEQFMEGPAYVQYFSNSPAQPVDIPPQETSYRIAGGTSSLIEKLAESLSPEELVLGESVQKVELHNNSLKIFTTQSEYEAEKVILAIPPRLIARSISFSPELPTDITEIAEQTHTWMEDSIKVALIYKSRFWKKRLLSGAVFSNVGPVTEFYDQTNAEDTRFALCGFMNSAYQSLSKAEREEKVVTQMTQIFGEEATDYLAYEETVWSEEKYTKASSDFSLYPHQNNGHSIFQKSFMQEKLFFASAETSTQSPGYMDGAVYAANEIAKKIIG